MSDYDTGDQLDPGYTGDEQPETLDPGYTGNDQPDTYGGGNDVDYGQYSEGQEHGELDQLHHAAGSEADYNNQFAVYEQDHASAESTSFDQGHHVVSDSPAGAHYEESDFTSFDHNSAEADHVFAAEGSESSHQAEFSNLDALRQQFDANFAEGTQFHGEGGAAGISAVSS